MTSFDIGPADWCKQCNGYGSSLNETAARCTACGGTGLAPLPPLNVGQRVRLCRDVDRFPHFVARAGMAGTVVEVDSQAVCIRMDAALPNCEEWGNEIVWADVLLSDLAADVEVTR